MFHDKALVGRSLSVAVAVLVPLSAVLLALAPFRRAMRLARDWLGEPAHGAP